MKTKTQLSKVPTVLEFAEAWSLASQNMEKVCVMFAQMAQANPNIYSDVLKAVPHLSRNVLARMEQAGLGRMAIELVLDNSPVAKRLALNPSPSQQAANYRKAVQVVTLENGIPVAREVSVAQMSRQQCELAIDEHGEIRPPEKQIEVLKSLTPKTSAKAAQRYKLDGGSLVVMPSSTKTVFDIPTLEDIIARLKEKNIQGLESTMRKNQLKR